MSASPRNGASSPAVATPTGRNVNSERLRARAVWLYYAEGMKQSKIAEALGTTRVTIVRLLADARRRNEVRITISSSMAELAGLEVQLSQRYGIQDVIVCPSNEAVPDPTQSIAASAGAYVSGMMQPGMSIGVGWGKTLHSMLQFIESQTLSDLSVVSLLGGFSHVRHFNPADFAWRFAELFQGEGYLVPAPALVDSPETRRALIERCGIGEVFAKAHNLDMVLLSVGGIAQGATSFQTGYLTDAEREDLKAAGAAGDLLYNFIDVDGCLIDHPVNDRTISVSLEQLANAKARIIVSGGPEKVDVLHGAIAAIRPSALVTDDASARTLLAM